MLVVVCDNVVRNADGSTCVSFRSSDGAATSAPIVLTLAPSPARPRSVERFVRGRKYRVRLVPV